MSNRRESSKMQCSRTVIDDLKACTRRPVVGVPASIGSHESRGTAQEGERTRQHATVTDRNE